MKLSDFILWGIVGFVVYKLIEGSSSSTQTTIPDTASLSSPAVVNGKIYFSSGPGATPFTDASRLGYPPGSTMDMTGAVFDANHNWIRGTGPALPGIPDDGLRQVAAPASGLTDQQIAAITQHQIDVANGYLR